MLIVIGIAPFLIRDLAHAGRRPARASRSIKAQTLGASTWQIVLRVVLPQIMPRLIDARAPVARPGLAVPDLGRGDRLRPTGLGYRIFLVRRYLAMDVILPYVAWITLLAFLMDLALVAACRAGVFPWAHVGGAADERASSVRDVWVEYGDQVVLERINLDIAARRLPVAWSARPAAARSTFLRLLLGQERPTRGAIMLDGEPLPPEPAPRPRRRLPALLGVSRI